MAIDNTHKPFIWRKKYEELGIEIDEKKIEEEFRRRAEANRVELQKIKERQLKRELEYRQKLSDNEMIQRQKEAEQHEHWEQQEDEFLLKQRKQKSKIRIRDGRAKTIDLFSHYIDIFGVKIKDTQTKGTGYVQEGEIDLSDSPVELLNPSEWFNGLRLSDLEELEPGIIEYMKADSEGNELYWQDLLDITRNEISKLEAAKKQEVSAVANDIKALIDGKSIVELDEMEDDIEKTLCDNDPTIDESFYRNFLMRLRAQRAKLRLTYGHKNNLKRQKTKILDDKELAPTRVVKNEVSDRECSPGNENFRHGVQGLKLDDATDEKETEDQDEDDIGDPEDGPVESKPGDNFEETRQKCIEEYKQNGYSPVMVKRSDLGPGIVTANFEEDYKLLEYQRNKVCNASSLSEAKMATMTNEEREFMNAANKGMDAGEVAFSCEAPVRDRDNRNQTYIWADKYQPRKPRYFNRVHTGFEWNKYNQTHYDIDNPPPKVVQGYKFNIFYPDLIDKSKAPSYSIAPCKDDKDFCIIRFTAGPPYEDIAFKIVHREWNNTPKSGYRCQFINNMLQLWFQFKRCKYRR